ncbi:MAG: glycoside hydrolase family 66 protein [Dysgonamonadaceae bacterium]
MKKIYILVALCVSVLSGCSDYYNTNNDPITYGQSYMPIDISTDKAAYKPGETVTFSMKELPDGAKVRYSFLGNILSESPLTSKTWTWTPPHDDFKGYMAEIYTVSNGVEAVYANIAVDVSSDWAKFPRYGFLSDYGKISTAQMQQNIEMLNRFHINGLQFYDWMYEHQRPLAGTVENPATSWTDIFNRTCYLATVKGYIAEAKSKDMKTMFYNLCYGALKDAASDGVATEWYIFKDANHAEQDFHELSSGRSNIYLTNPGNTDWQTYLSKRNQDVYDVFDFDGYHIDQLGGRGTRYDYNGNVVDLPATYASFITAMKTAQPTKRLLFNAVSGYGQEYIAPSAVDFLYTEVWGARSGDSPDDSYGDLINTMNQNLQKANGTKNIVLAAYMNYDVSSSGFVNKPGVLLADAAIFAWGGAHLELGEHYLTNEYFPNNNLQMKADLAKALVGYYDFSVAYQNLLRDGGEFQAANVAFTNSSIAINPWPAAKGEVATIGKKVGGKDIFHLINFANASTMVWRDPNGTQTEPTLIESPAVDITVSGTPTKVWFASPDINGGVAQQLTFTQSGNKISLTLPSLKYWDMVVVEY